MEVLRGAVQSYAWGDTTAIAELQGRVPTGKPEAELWLGAHPIAPGRLCAPDRSLADAVAAEPASLLGPAVMERFGGFPFLLKVLAAAEPLSIQAHPGLDTARAGFAREEAATLARNSPTRTYRDANHKPELICALTPFVAKCGFRPLADTQLIVEALAGERAEAHGSNEGPGVADLAEHLEAPGEAESVLAATLAWLLRLDVESARNIVGDVVRRCGALLATGSLPTALAAFEPDLAWSATLDRFHPGDVGVVVALLLNHVELNPGEAMFLSAGNLHAYLRGTGVELMANSDNVIRGGLTTKHIDVEELLTVVDTHPAAAPVQAPSSACHRYHTPVDDFSLTRLSGGQARFSPVGPEVLLVTHGRAIVGLDQAPDTAALELARGQAALIAPIDGPYVVETVGDATVWRASVGLDPA